MFVRVAIAIPSPKTFTYTVPENHVSAVAVGKRVLVPFGKRHVTGFILEILAEAVFVGMAGPFIKPTGRAESGPILPSRAGPGQRVNNWAE